MLAFAIPEDNHSFTDGASYQLQVPSSAQSPTKHWGFSMGHVRISIQNLPAVEPGGFFMVRDGNAPRSGERVFRRQVQQDSFGT